MPTYQYACPDCGHQFEQRQKFTDEPVKRCPNCQRRHVYRVINQVAVTFKGSGWYITDSKSSDIKTVKPKADSGEADKDAGKDKDKEKSAPGEAAEAKAGAASEAVAKPASDAKPDKDAGKKK